MAVNQPLGGPPYSSPLDTHGGKVTAQWLQWFNRLQKTLQSFLWVAIDFGGSNLTDIQTRNHNDLQNFQGGMSNQHYHLTQAQDGIFTSGTIHQVLHGSPTLPTWSAVDLTADVTGILPPTGGGTGVANGAANTITFSGNYGLTLTLSAITSVTLPSAGTLATLAGIEELTNKTLTSSVAKGTWTASGTWTVPAFTVGGAISGGGNSVDNVVINPTTALAIRGSTMKATTAGGFISSDNSAGITTTITTAGLVGKTITIKDGIITGFA